MINTNILDLFPHLGRLPSEDLCGPSILTGVFPEVDNDVKARINDYCVQLNEAINKDVREFVNNQPRKSKNKARCCGCCVGCGCGYCLSKTISYVFSCAISPIGTLFLMSLGGVVGASTAGDAIKHGGDFKSDEDIQNYPIIPKIVAKCVYIPPKYPNLAKAIDSVLNQEIDRITKLLEKLKKLESTEDYSADPKKGRLIVLMRFQTNIRSELQTETVQSIVERLSYISGSFVKGEFQKFE